MTLKNPQVLMNPPSDSVVGLRSQPNLQTPLDGLVFGDGHGDPTTASPPLAIVPLSCALAPFSGPRKCVAKASNKTAPMLHMGCVVSVVPHVGDSGRGGPAPD